MIKKINSMRLMKKTFALLLVCALVLSNISTLSVTAAGSSLSLTASNGIYTAVTTEIKSDDDIIDVSSGTVITGTVKAEKSAAWTDYENGKAEITFDLSGEASIDNDTNADVIIVLDASVSMAKYDDNGTLYDENNSSGYNYTETTDKFSTFSNYVAAGLVASDLGISTSNSGEEWAYYYNSNGLYELVNYGTGSRWASALSAVSSAANQLLTDDGNNVSLITFRGRYTDNQNNSSKTSADGYESRVTYYSEYFTDQKDNINSLITTIEANEYNDGSSNSKYNDDDDDYASVDGGTDYTSALEQAIVFADELGTDSNSYNRDLYVIFISDGEPDGDAYNGTDAASALMNTYGATIYPVSIGVVGTSTGLSALNTGNDVIMTDGGNLSEVLGDIIEEISIVAEDVVIDDVVSEYFNLDTEALTSADYSDETTTDGVTTYKKDGYPTITVTTTEAGLDSVSIEMDDLTESGASFTIPVTLKDKYLNVDGEYITNDSASVSYTWTGSDGTKGTKTITDIETESLKSPKLLVRTGDITVNYVDETTGQKVYSEIIKDQPIDTKESSTDVSVTADMDADDLANYSLKGSDTATATITYDSVADNVTDGTVTFLVELKGYAVTYNANDGEGDTVVNTYAVTETATIAANGFTRTGYTFTKWNTAADGSGISYVAGKEYTGDAESTLTLYAQWDAIEYTVTFDANSGSFEDDNSAEKVIAGDYDTTFETPTSPTKAADSEYKYEFAYWSLTKDGEEVDVNKTITGDVTYYAIYSETAIVYNIEYELDGGTEVGNYPTSYTVESDEISIENPVKAGYTFTGWSVTVNKTSSDDSILKSGTIVKGSTGNIVFTANWEIDTDYQLVVGATGYEGTYDADAHNVIASEETTTKTGSLSDEVEITYLYSATEDGEYTKEMPAETITNAGTVTVWVKAITSVDGYHDSEPVEVVATVTKAALTVQATVENASIEYGTDVVYSSVVTEFKGNDNIDLKLSYVVSGTTVGNQTVTVSGTYDNDTNPLDNYTITYLPVSFEIYANDGLSLELSGTAYNGIYDGDSHKSLLDVGLTVLIDGVEISAEDVDSITYEYNIDGGAWSSEVPTVKDAGTYEIGIQVTVTKDNYTSVTTTATETATVSQRVITVVANSDEVVYSGTAYVPSYHIYGVISSEFGDVTVDGVVMTPTDATDVDDYVVSASDGTASSENYRLVYEDGTLEITPATITVTASSDQSAEYGYDIPTITWTYDEADVLEGDTVNIEGVVTSTTATNESPVGTDYVTTASAGTSGNDNYVLEYVNGTFEIYASDDLTLTATNYSGVYDAATHEITVDVSLKDAKVEYSLDGEEWSEEEIKLTEVTDGAVTVYVRATLDNYTTVETSATITITPATITVTASSDQSAEYGYDIPTITWTYDEADVLEGDTVNIEGVVTSTTATNESPVGTDYVTEASAGTSENGNYVLEYVEGTFEIYASDDLTLKATNYSETYDAAAHGITVDVSLEDAKVEYSLDGEDWSEEIKLTDVTNGAVTVYVRATLDNYTTVETRATITITPAPVTVTADDVTITYGTAVEEATLTYDITSGTVYDEEMTFTAVTDEAGVVDAGTYTEAIDVTYTENSNYEVTVVKADLIVEEGSLEVEVDDEDEAAYVANAGAYNGTYDAVAHDAIWSLSIADGNGNPVDDVTVTYTMEDGTEFVNEIPTVTDAGTYPITITVSKENYTDATIEVTATVGKAALTVTAANKIMEEGADVPTLDYTVTGLKGTDTFAASSITTAATSSSAVGTYAIDVAGVAETDNYTVTYNDAVLTIYAEDELVVTATGEETEYDGEEHELVTDVEVSDPDAEVEYSTDGGETWTDEVPTGTDAGEYEVIVRVTDEDGDTTEITVVATINPATVIITVADVTKAMDDEDPTFTASISGLLGTDTMAYTVVRMTAEDAVGQQWLTAEYIANPNYNVIVIDGAFIITEAVVTDDADTTTTDTTTAGIVVTTAGTVVTPAVEDDTVEIEEDEAPLADAVEDTTAGDTTEIEDDEVPLAASVASASWALLNLILAILTAATSVVLLIGYFINRKAKEDEDEEMEEDQEDAATRKNKGLARVLSLVPSIAAIVAFILTENMLNPMVIVDQWTVVMLIIAIVQGIVAFTARKVDKENEEEEEVVAE